MNFGFNDDANLHLAHTDRVRALYPERFRMSGDNIDLAKVVSTALGLRPIIVVGTFNPDPAHVLAQAQLALALPNNPQVQLFNEPNNKVFGGHDSATINIACRHVVDALGPDEIIGPAMAPATGWRSYMEAAYANTGLKHVALHLYPLADTFTRYVNLAFETAHACGEVVHVTEAGCQRSQFPDQKTSTKQLYGLAELRGAKTYIHHRLGEPDLPNNWEKNARLWVIRKDHTRTGIYDAFHQLR